MELLDSIYAEKMILIYCKLPTCLCIVLRTEYQITGCNETGLQEDVGL
jgi:hypothetical protein